jgi:hypothetical protein
MYMVIIPSVVAAPFSGVGCVCARHQAELCNIVSKRCTEAMAARYSVVRTGYAMILACRRPMTIQDAKAIGAVSWRLRTRVYSARRLQAIMSTI